MKKKFLPFDYFLLAITLLTIVINNQLLLGSLIIFVSLYMLFKVRKTRLLLILFSIIGFVNMHISIYDIILDGYNSPLWQTIGLRSTEYLSVTAHSILITLSLINLFLNKKFIRIVIENESHENVNRLKNKNSKVIFIGAILFLIIILFYGFVSIDFYSSYSSVTNPIFEYSIIIFVIAWYFSEKNFLSFLLLSIFVFLYSFAFLYVGDRSSVFMYLIAYITMYNYKKLNIKKIIVFSFFAVLLANSVAYIRNNEIVSIQNMFGYILDRGYYSDTISWSFYASISITALYDFMSNSYMFIFGYLITIFTFFNPRYTNMALYASENFEVLRNYGGGIYSSFFYGMLGYTGVVIGAALLGYIIKMLFSFKHKYSIIYIILLISFSMRWYLYGPVPLFRGVLLFTFILLSLIDHIILPLFSNIGASK